MKSILVVCYYTLTIVDFGSGEAVTKKHHIPFCLNLSDAEVKTEKISDVDQSRSQIQNQTLKQNQHKLCCCCFSSSSFFF